MGRHWDHQPHQRRIYSIADLIDEKSRRECGVRNARGTIVFTPQSRGRLRGKPGPTAILLLRALCSAAGEGRAMYTSEACRAVGISVNTGNSHIRHLRNAGFIAPSRGGRTPLVITDAGRARCEEKG